MVCRAQSPAKQFYTPFDLVLADDFCRYPGGGMLPAGDLVEHSILGFSAEGHIPERLQSINADREQRRVELLPELGLRDGRTDGPEPFHGPGILAAIILVA